MPLARDNPRAGAMTPSSRRSTTSVGIPPGRSTCGGEHVQSTIVDSIPIGHGPPSRMRSTASPRSARTWAAVVGETCPNRFADGAARPPPNLRKRSSAIGCAGTRKATVSRPPVTAWSTRAAFGTSTVSGPGQHESASIRADSGMDAAHVAMSSTEAICTIRGWSMGLPFAAKIRRTACSFEASPASP